MIVVMSIGKYFHALTRRKVIILSDPYLLRDSNGDPLGKHEKNPLLKLFDNLFPNEPFQIHEMEENVVKEYFREKREREGK